MIVAQIVGGPHDGEEVGLEDAFRSFKVAVPMRPAATWINDDVVPSRGPDYREVAMVPQLTRNGWRLYWREPKL